MASANAEPRRLFKFFSENPKPHIFYTFGGFLKVVTSDLHYQSKNLLTHRLVMFPLQNSAPVTRHQITSSRMREQYVPPFSYINVQINLYPSDFPVSGWFACLLSLPY